MQHDAIAGVGVSAMARRCWRNGASVPSVLCTPPPSSAHFLVCAPPSRHSVRPPPVLHARPTGRRCLRYHYVGDVLGGAAVSLLSARTISALCGGDPSLLRWAHLLVWVPLFYGAMKATKNLKPFV